MKSVVGWLAHTHTSTHTCPHLRPPPPQFGCPLFGQLYIQIIIGHLSPAFHKKKKTATTTVRLALNLLILPELRLILCVVAGLTVALITIKYYLLTMPGREHNVTPLAFALASE